MTEAQIEALVNEVRRLDGAFNAMINENTNQQRQLAELAQNRQPPAAPALDPFRIPDPIKGLPTFEGNRKQLAQWLTTARQTLNLFDEYANDVQKKVYLQAVINKISGSARDAICVAGDIATFDDVEKVLTHALGDKRDIATYKSMLWQNRMSEKVDLHLYYKRTCETVQNIKNIAKLRPQYADHWAAIDLFIEEDLCRPFKILLRLRAVR